MYQGEYIPPTLTIDSIIFQLTEKGLAVLLIQRAAEPFKDHWALPGGYCAAGETTREAMGRVLQAKAGVSAEGLTFIEQLYAFDTVARDPRGHAVSISYLGLARDIEPTASDTTQNPQFFPINDLPKLAYDHQEIINYALQRLQSKLTYTNIVFALLPRQFTLTQLQTAYEAIINRPLDKRNFRRKILSLDFLRDTEKKSAHNAYRPARLYEFQKQDLQSLEHIYE